MRPLRPNANPSSTPPLRAAALATALLLALPTLATGCAPKTSADLRLASAELPVDLAPALTRHVYSPIDRSSADIYLTDLEPRDLARFIADPTFPTTGTIVHVHLFVQPNAGRTPIDDTAFSATVRYVVLARGRIGIYDGGGFLLPDGRPGDDRFTAGMSAASLRRSLSTPGFIDRIGRGSLELTFTARRDESESDLIRRAADRAVLRALRTTDATPADKADQADP